MIRRGYGVSPGIAIGRALVVDGHRVAVARRLVAAGKAAAEVARLRRAIAIATTELEALRQRARGTLGEETASILDAQLLMLVDDSLVGEAERQIEREMVNGEWAIMTVVERLTQRFRMLDDECFRDRARDIQDVGERIQRAMSGLADDLPTEDGEYILVAHDPAPSDTARLDPVRIKGIVIDAGGRTSHTGIIAKSLEIPAVVGLGDATREIKTGDLLIVDGSQGEVVIAPSETLISEYRNKRLAAEQHDRELLTNRDLPTVTADGHKVYLQANVDFPAEVEAAVHYGAEGIGLFRSEFLFLNLATSGPPTEDEQFEVYRNLAERVYPRSAIVRTVDFGGGKVRDQELSGKEPNPILGLRAIRYCLEHKDLFKAQLRALLRASVHGRLKIMFPLVSSVTELRQARRLLEEAKDELRMSRTPINERLSVGIMIEVPAAAAIADLLAPEVDFFSIGTNDLIQFFLAIDRDNALVSSLYEPLHPGVLRTIKYVVDCAHRAGVRVGMCGEMAADPVCIPLLIGLGLDELSMNAVNIPLAKRIIRRHNYEEAAALACHVLNLSTSKEIEEYVLERQTSRFPDGYH